MIVKLDPDVLGFPDPHLGEDDGLFAIGGDLSIDRLLLAYSYGIFLGSTFGDGMTFFGGVRWTDSSSSPTRFMYRTACER